MIFRFHFKKRLAFLRIGFGLLGLFIAQGRPVWSADVQSASERPKPNIVVNRIEFSEGGIKSVEQLEALIAAAIDRQQRASAPAEGGTSTAAPTTVLVLVVGDDGLYQDVARREREQAEEAALIAETQPEPEPEPEPEPRVMINRLQFSGNTLFTTEELQSMIAEEMGREFSLSELQALIASVEKRHHARGNQLVRIVIPEQDVVAQGGMVNLVVLEGNLGEIHVAGNKRYSEERVLRSFQKLEKGKPIAVPDLEKGLLTLNSFSGVKVSSTLSPGETMGSTDINLEVEESRRIEGGLSYNNFGTKTSGKHRVGTHLSLPNTLGFGDVIAASFTSSIDFDEMNFGQVSYTLPLGVSGLQASAYTSRGRSEIGREFALLDIKGDSESHGLGFIYPYLLEARKKLGLEAWIEAKDSTQTLLGTVTSDDKIRKLRFGANFERQTVRGRTFINFGVEQGLGEALGGMPNESLVSSRAFARADNNFTKLTGGLTQVYSFTPRLFAIGRVSGQYAFDPMVAGEQWSIGGANSVRGHDESKYLGDHGFTSGLEGRLTIFPRDDRFQFVGFAEHAQVFVDRPTLVQDSDNQISGAGFGLRANLFDEMLRFRGDIAWPLGDKRTDDNNKPVYYFQSEFSF